MSIRSTVKALLVENGRLLLNQCRTADGQTYYDLPGGGQHLYETMEEAVAREVLEETGIPVEVELFAGLVEEITTDPALRGGVPGVFAPGTPYLPGTQDRRSPWLLLRERLGAGGFGLGDAGGSGSAASAASKSARAYIGAAVFRDPPLFGAL